MTLLDKFSSDFRLSATTIHCFRIYETSVNDNKFIAIPLSDSDVRIASVSSNGSWIVRRKSKAPFEWRSDSTEMWIVSSEMDVLVMAECGISAVFGYSAWPDMSDYDHIFAANDKITLPAGAEAKTHFVDWSKSNSKSPSDLFIKLGGVKSDFLKALDTVKSFEPKVIAENDRVYSDIALSDQIHSQIQDRYLYDPSAGAWYMWDENARRWDTGSVNIRRYIAAYLKAKAEATGADHILSDYKVTSIENCLKYLHDATIRKDSLNSEKHLLMCRNGVVDLRDSSIKEASPDHMITMTTRFPYQPSNSTSWENHIHKIFDGNVELARYFQKCVGYSITGETRERVFFMMVGGGRNGKSVTLSTIYALLGDYAATLPFDVVSSSISSAPSPSLLALRTSRMAVISECDARATFSESTIKTLTGQDSISIRGLYEKSNTVFVPRAKMWMALNHLPTVKDGSEAFWDRVRVLPFHHRIQTNEVNRSIGAQFLSNAEGILSWCIDGARLYYAEGLDDIPDEVKRPSDEYREREDWIATFIKDSFATDGWVSFSDIMNKYLEWSRNQTMGDVVGSRSLSRLLHEKGFQRKRKTDGVEYLVRKAELN